MHRNVIRKTDYGTIILHWSWVIALSVSIATGWRIAADALDGPPGGWLDLLIPGAFIWRGHVLAGLTLFACAIAYSVYIARAALFRRIRPDRARLAGLFRRGQTRWGALNVVLYWLFFLLLAVQLVTGFLLYAGYGGRVVQIHRLGMWLILSYAALHVVAHWRLGGTSQLLRIFRPSRLTPTPKVAAPSPVMRPRHGAEATRMHRPQPAPRHDARPHIAARVTHRRDNATLKVNPLTVAVAAGLVAAAMIASVDRAAQDVLVIRKIAKTGAPVLDGDMSDAAWRKAQRVIVPTQQGANFGGTGTSVVEIRAVHDGETAYLAFTWEDPTRSLKHLPLIKQADGWRLLNDRYDIEDENSYYEDKFSVMLSTNAGFVGDRVLHLGQAPLAGKPQAFSGRGLHYTADGSYVDVWHWKASRGGLLGYCDNNYFGPPAEAKKDEIEGRSRYKAGYGTDPGKAFYANNFDQRPPGGYETPIQPKRLPKDWEKTRNAMGPIDLDANQSEVDGARWWLTDDESVPYAREQDQRFPVGAVIPGVLISGTYSGERAYVRCAARWAAGRWTLEVARRLDTGSKYDVPIAGNTFMWVAAFDHSQTRHTRHMRPVQLDIE